MDEELKLIYVHAVPIQINWRKNKKVYILSNQFERGLYQYLPLMCIHLAIIDRAKVLTGRVNSYLDFALFKKNGLGSF